MKVQNSKNQVNRHYCRKAVASRGARASENRDKRSSKSCTGLSLGSGSLGKEKLSIKKKKVASKDKEKLCPIETNMVEHQASQECSSEHGTDSRCSPYMGMETDRTSTLESGSEPMRSRGTQHEDMPRELAMTPAENPTMPSTVPSPSIPEELTVELVEHLIQLKEQLRNLELSSGRRRGDMDEGHRSKAFKFKASDKKSSSKKSEDLEEETCSMLLKKTRELRNRENDGKNILSADLDLGHAFSGETDHETFGNKLVSIIHMAWRALSKYEDLERKALSSNLLLERMTSVMPRWIHRVESKRFLQRCFSCWRVFALSKCKRTVANMSSKCQGVSTTKTVWTARTSSKQDYIRSKRMSSPTCTSDFMDENLNTIDRQRQRQRKQEQTKASACETGLRSTSRALDVLQASLGQELQDLHSLLSKEMQSLQKQIGDKEKITGRPSSRGATWKASLSAIWNVCNDLGEFLFEARSQLKNPVHKVVPSNNKRTSQSPTAISSNQKRRDSLRQVQGKADVQQTLSYRAPDRTGLPNSNHSKRPIISPAKKPIVNFAEKMRINPVKRLKNPDTQQEVLKKQDHEQKVSEKPTCQQTLSENPKPATFKLQLLGNDHIDSEAITCCITEKQSPYAILELPTNVEVIIETSTTRASNSTPKAAKENIQRMSPRNRRSKVQNCIGAQHAAHLEQEINRLKLQRQLLEEKLEQSLEGALVPLQRPSWSKCLKTNHLVRNRGDSD
eukprot:Gb_28847 [translate_table: standard]